MTTAGFEQIYHDIDCVQAKRLRCRDEGILENPPMTPEAINKSKSRMCCFWTILLHAESPTKIKNISTRHSSEPNRDERHLL
jgi:hypothetical protein